MDLWLHVNGEDYPIVPGCTLTDNMGEELDSMQIRVPHVPNIRMKPYDDAYVHDGWYTGRTYGRICKIPEGRFYRHFLIFNYDRTEVNQLDNVYNYSITLVSETKYLEKVLMPNRTITIPFEKPGRSVLEMSEIFTERYTPKIKHSDGEGTWGWKDRFLVSNSEKVVFDDDDKAELARRNLEIVSDVFSDVQAMETSFNNPTLREALTKIFSVSNCIPVVFDGIIFARDISKKRNKFTEIAGKVWDTSTMSGDQYVDRLRKNYSSGLTDKNGCVFHEYVGFRNMNVSSMRYSDLCIEVKNPIYKINRFVLCYYSKKKDGKLVRKDLTSFVLPSSTRAFLSNDYINFITSKPQTINGYLNADGTYVLGICDYKFMTVQYDIGSNRISGFGETVQHTANGIDNIKRIVLENIVDYSLKETNVYDEFNFYIDKNEDTNITIHNYSVGYSIGDIYAQTPPSNFWNLINDASSMLIGKDIGGDGLVSNESLKMKSLFFEIEYQGIISSTVMVSKDAHDGDIMAIDNQQESMAIMEQDGITSKYKVNRLGNETASVTARVLGFDDLVDIGDYDENHGICYKRTISLEKDFISVNYTFAKEYVITNYFTGVFSKYRSSAYASMAQSVERNENVDLHLLLSLNKLLRTPSDGLIYSYDFELQNIISAIYPTESDDIKKSIGYFYVEAPLPGIVIYEGTPQKKEQYYSLDRAYYMSGNSMCCTVAMPDSETAGTYIKNLFPEPTDFLSDSLNSTKYYGTSSIFGTGMDAYSVYARDDSPFDDITGTAQGFLSLPTSRFDGTITNITFGYSFSKTGIQDEVYEVFQRHDEEEVFSIYDKHLLMLPRLDEEVSKKIGKDNYFEVLETYKDAKEVISETFQIEPITDNGILVSPYFMKLSDLFNSGKVIRTKNVPVSSEDNVILVCSEQLTSFIDVNYGAQRKIPFFTHALGIYSPRLNYDLSILKLLINTPINESFSYRSDEADENRYGCGFRGTLKVNVEEIKSVHDEYIEIEMSMEFIFDEPYRDYFGEEETGNVESGYFFVRELEGCVKLETGKFITKWRNAKYLLKEKSLYEFSEDPFYPSEVSDRWLPTNYHAYRPWNIFNYLYCNATNYGYSEERKSIFFEPGDARTCFVFNFDSFPFNHEINALYENEQRRTFSNKKYDQYSWLMAPVRFSHTPKYDQYYGWNPLSSLDDSDKGLVQNYRRAVGGQINDANGGRSWMVNLKDILSEKTYKDANVFWFIRHDVISGTFKTSKTFNSIESMENEGFIETGMNIHVSNKSIRITAGAGDGPKKASAYMFYLDDDRMLHFVFGCNVDKVGQVYAALIYVSLVYDRSRTVFNADMEPVLMTANYAKVSSDADNICVDKNDANL